MALQEAVKRTSDLDQTLVPCKQYFVFELDVWLDSASAEIKQWVWRKCSCLQIPSEISMLGNVGQHLKRGRELSFEIADSVGVRPK